ncbi:hypothetical protein GH714_037021 [Hevea brasiliensis]|uniref:CCHC-type domain-containing protein n=1 Tax=Hevea brasiliensis TaxID=3981 RepID=A0A6A6N4Y0_HEVBR|nr:hypothetical protein GH714_037021 [Hevea brasiliensis]
MEPAKAAPTGCYKCGRPGHWSRDCPDSNPNPNSNPPSKSTNLSTSNSSRSFPIKSDISNSKPVAEKPKKAPRSRPKLTPEILLGDDGLGYVLRHFPRHFMYRGRGHEVRDLGNLIRLYSEWHSRLLPYYSFDEFVHKVEQVAATRRVKIIDLCTMTFRIGGLVTSFSLYVYVDICMVHTGMCGEENWLRKWVNEQENGIYELEEEICHSAPDEAVGLHQQGDQHLRNYGADGVQEDMLHESDDRATESCLLHFYFLNSGTISYWHGATSSNNIVGLANEVLITDEQRARMEANRLKALERAAARARSLQSS